MTSARGGAGPGERGASPLHPRVPGASVRREVGRAPDPGRGWPHPRVPVVIADPDLRPVVVWTVDDLELDPVAVPTWRDGVAWIPGRPTLAICDLDQVPLPENAALPSVIERTLASRIRFVVLGARQDIGRRVAELGADAGVRTPLDLAQLDEVVCRLVGAGGDTAKGRESGRRGASVGRRGMHNRG